MSLKSTEALCHDNEEWCKIWRRIDLPLRNRPEEFDEFWPELLKISEILILMCPFWAKYTYTVWAKKVQRSYLSWNWREIQNLERNRLIVSKFTEGIWQILAWALERSYLTKTEEELTCGLKNDVRNLANFHQKLMNSKFNKTFYIFNRNV